MMKGISRAVSAMSATPMPSTPSSYRTPKSLIQACDSVSWKRLPPGSKRASTMPASTRVPSEKSSASHLAAVRRAAGTAAVAIAPIAGSTAVAVRRGKDM